MPNSHNADQRPTPEDHFVSNMRQFREKRGWSQSEFVEALRENGLTLHRQTVQKIEGGTRPLKLGEAQVIARTLGLDIESMMEPPAHRAAEEDLADLRELHDNLFVQLANFYERQRLVAFHLDTVGFNLTDFEAEVLTRTHNGLHDAAVRRLEIGGRRKALARPYPVRSSEGVPQDVEGQTCHQKLVIDSHPDIWTEAGDEDKADGER